MKPGMDTSAEETARRNYNRLFTLRNIEIAAIALGIAVAGILFDLALPLRALLVLLALIISVNVFTWIRLKTGHRFSDRELFVQMLLDVAGLTGVFFFTGGASNPFVWFYLLPLMIAATILPRSHTWMMAVITVASYSALFFIGTPGTEHAHHATGFRMHIFGMWLGFVMSAGIVAVIIVGMAHSLRQRDRKLAEARESALQNERLIALGTLATGAAHELGTPLGTMAILTAELEKQYTDEAHPELHKKLGILEEQIRRCKEALSVISVSAGAGRAEAGHRMPVGSYLDEVIAQWQTQGQAATLESVIDRSGPASEIIAERTLTQALVNLLNNAADASPDHVTLEADWSATALRLAIFDRGPGLNREVHSQLGKTPVSTKTEGLGVGLYLAQATIQRLGGTLLAESRTGAGTTVRITLPLLAPPAPEPHSQERTRTEP